MRLNPDLVRNLLLLTEEIPFNKRWTNEQISDHKLMKGFSVEEIAYTLQKLGPEDAGLTKSNVTIASGKLYSMTISSLTYNGHQLLDDVRDNKVWKTTKAVASDMSSLSISTLASIAGTVLSNLISNRMNI